MWAVLNMKRPLTLCGPDQIFLTGNVTWENPKEFKSQGWESFHILCKCEILKKRTVKHFEKYALPSC